LGRPKLRLFYVIVVADTLQPEGDTLNTITSLLQNLGFSNSLDVMNQNSITHLIPERSRCGIYVLHLSDDTYYVGLSKDVTERFRQHRLRYSDITAISFKRLRQDNNILRAEERQIIYELDAANIPLLNKVHNTIPYSSSPLDLLISSDQQRDWLDTGVTEWAPLAESQTPIKPEKLVRDKRKMDEFHSLSYRRQIAAALKQYISTTIPAYQLTEGKYWSMSCLPSTNGGWRAAAISLSYMETFVIFKDGSCFVNIASTVFDEHFVDDAEFLKTYPGTSIEIVGYEAAGFDQLNVRAADDKVTLSILHNPVVQKAARLMNLSLMRQRATLYSGSHSPMLTEFVMRSK